MNTIKTGIVGTGYTVGIAANHVNGYAANPHTQLVALYDIVPNRAEAWAKEKNLSVQICNSYDELLDAVDAVSICTPNYAHVPLVIRALEKGMHVLCEKPLSVDAPTAKTALHYASCASTIAMIGFSYRGIPALRLLKDLLDEGRLGNIFSYRQTLGGCRIANPAVKLEWRMQQSLSGTGALADFGCHMLDLCDWLLADTLGPMVKANGITACSIPQREEIFTSGQGSVTNDDTAAFNVTFAKGGVASFLASRLGVARHTLEIYSEGGMVLFRDDKPNELEVWWKDKNAGYAGQPQTLTAPDPYQISPWFNAEIDEFVNCIQTGTQPQRNFARAVYIQTILDTIDAACKSGETLPL